ncbi:hypothetical protein BGW80DRAFT_1567081 [Lactifluus volemus]|nr:hypothetical protein BGW80DRAFT_1567081 [Lactifluus volemus]
MRIEGYKAIVRMSEEHLIWVERTSWCSYFRAMNPQRLRWSIVQHLELDYAERSQRSNRSSRQTHHLRTLVVAFLAEDVRRSLLTKLQGRGNICAEQDQAPIDTLLKSVSTFSGASASASKITRDILVFLPSFNSGRPTGCGNELFQAFLAQAMSLLKVDLAPRRIPASQERASNCATCVPRKRRVGPFQALALLLLVACSHQTGPESDELVSMWCQVVDPLAIILLASIRIAPSDVQAWRSCEMLLRTS